MTMMKLKDYRQYKGCLEYYGDLYSAQKIDLKELDIFRRQSKMLIAKHIYDFDCKDETNFWYIIQDKFIDLSEYPSSARKQIRKSLSVYKYEKVEPNEMHLKGYKVYCDGLLRHGINNPKMDEIAFHSYVDYNIQRGVEYWMGYDIESGEAAMWESVLVQKYCVIEEVEKLSIHFTKHNPTYGLNYELMRYYLKERGYKCIIAGSRSLTEHSNVQDFLISKMQFRRAYCRLQCSYDIRLLCFLFLLYPFYCFLPNGKLKGIIDLKKYSK